jgi:NAD(P)-dependent dehydrogenase (short-subunit alcohol dehydrogenase family)
MDLELGGLTALVTGASRGIGKAIARRLASEGCRLHLTARSADALERARSELRRSADAPIEIHPLDLTAPGAPARLADLCADADIVINNAGATPTGPIEQTTEPQWREGLELKILATVLLTKAMYNRMCERRRGVIVNVIGNCGERPDPEIIIGTITNAGLMAFTRALGAVSPDHGVRVLGVNPGPTMTERLELLMRKKALDRTGSDETWRDLVAPLPFGRAATPDEVADLVVFAASARGTYISGTVLTVDGGVSARGHLF